MPKIICRLVTLLMIVPTVLWGESLQVMVDLRFQGESDSVRQATLRARSLSEEGSAEKTFEVRVPGSLEIPLERKRIWHFELEGKGLWSPGATIYTAPDLETVTLDAWAASRLTGKLRVEKGEEPPKAIKVRFQPSEKTGGSPAEKTLPCTVESLDFDCVLPAGKLDLRIRASGFISRYFWDVTLEAGTPRNLGALSLKRGSSLTGIVETADDSLLTETARVELRPYASGAPRGPRTEDRDEFSAERHPIGAKGFFHIEGIAPGTYALTVRQEGFAPASMAPVSILRNAESEIRDPIVLMRPLDLEVFIDPPVDGYGRPWSIQLLSEGFYPGHLDTIADKRLSESGGFEVSNVAPGRHYLLVSDSQGSRFARETIDLSEQSSSFEVELDLVEIEGEIFLGDEPLAAKLWFGGKTGQQRIPIESDTDGWFEGILPRAGAWRIDVRAESPEVSRNLVDIEIPEPTHGQPVFVELEVPNTTLSGLVIDPSGRPIQETSVVTAVSIETGLDSMIQKQTDEEGTFEFQGLEPGIYRLTAETSLDGRRAASEPTTVILSEERETDRIELVVRAMDEIRGVVESSDGSIPGAIVRIRPLTGGRSTTQLWPEGLTNRQGRFALQVPAASDRLEILVGAAGHELKLFSVLSPIDQPLRLRVEKLGGTLLIDLGDAASHESTLVPMVFQDGKAVGGPPGWLRWASSNGEPNHDPSRILIPLMAPGEYLVCLLKPTERNAMVWNLVSPNLQTCRGGYLQPHGRLEIDLNSGDFGARD